jgi:hypothetical protein
VYRQFLGRLQQLADTSESERFDTAADKPNLFFAEENLKAVRLDRDKLTGLWLLIVDDRKQGEWKFDLPRKDDYRALRPALGDLVENLPEAAPKAKATLKAKTRPAAAVAKMPEAEERDEPAASIPQKWFFGLMPQADNKFVGYRVYATANEFRILFTNGRTRATNYEQSKLVVGILIGGVVLVCLAFWWYSVQYLQSAPDTSNFLLHAHWMLMVAGFMVSVALVQNLRDKKRIADREDYLDNLSPEDFQLEANMKGTNIVVSYKDIEKIQLHSSGEREEIFEIVLHNRKRYQLLLPDKIDQKTARKVCEARCPDKFEVANPKERKKRRPKRAD